MIKIAIADDHAIIRAGLAQIISETPDMRVVAEARSGDEAQDIILNAEWDVFILDISMPGKNVLDLIRIAKKQLPNRALLVLSSYPEEQYALRMLRAGADAYLTKADAPEKLIAAIRNISEGGKLTNPELTKKLFAEHITNPDYPPHHTLTDREFQVFCAISKGKRINDIAEEMALSSKTISTYRIRLLKKLKATTNADIVEYAMEFGLLD